MKEFEAYAADCRRMAKAARTREDRTTWNSLAERWDRLAADAQRKPKGKPARAEYHHRISPEMVPAQSSVKQQDRWRRS